jgi:nitrogen fixation protein NifU and related proteins
MDAFHSDHTDEAKAAIPYGSRFWRHAQKPCNLGRCDQASVTAMGVGSCGDKLRIDLQVKEGTIEQIRCGPEGCLYTVAYASAMSTLAQGRTIDEALQLQPEDVVRELEGLPEDHLHCARLAVNTLGEAIAEYYRRQVIEKRPGTDSNLRYEKD